MSGCPKGDELLAAQFRVSLPTIAFLRTQGGAPDGHAFSEWEEFLESRDTASVAVEAGGNTGNETLKVLRARLLRAQAGKEEALKSLKELELDQRSNDLVPSGDAKKAIKKVLGPLRDLLDALPKAIAVQANPADPLLAEFAMRQAIDRVFRAMERPDAP